MGPNTTTITKIHHSEKTYHMANDGWVNEIQTPKIVENNQLAAIKDSINSLNISEIEYSKLINSSVILA